MLDIGWQELLVIGALALIVVGPKDLPGMLRSFGQWVGRLRGMARDFQRAMNDAARDADLKELSELRDLKNSMSGGMDFKSQAAKAQSFLNSDAADPDLPPEKKVEPAAEPETTTAAPGPVTSSAPVDKPDPAVMGDALPADEMREKAPVKAAET